MLTQQRDGYLAALGNKLEGVEALQGTEMVEALHVCPDVVVEERVWRAVPSGSTGLGDWGRNEKRIKHCNIFFKKIHLFSAFWFRKTKI